MLPDPMPRVANPFAPRHPSGRELGDLQEAGIDVHDGVHRDEKRLFRGERIVGVEWPAVIIRIVIDPGDGGLVVPDLRRRHRHAVGRLMKRPGSVGHE